MQNLLLSQIIIIVTEVICWQKVPLGKKLILSTDFFEKRAFQIKFEDRDTDMAASNVSRREFEELRNKVSSLEQDNEMLMAVVTNMSKVFASVMKPQNDVLDPFPLGDSKKIDATVRKIEKSDPINAVQFTLIEKYTNTSIYAEADFLRERIATAFATAYFRIHKAAIKRSFTFDETKPHIQRISEMEDKIDVQAFIKALKLSEAV